MNCKPLIGIVPESLPELASMQKVPDPLYYSGNLELLKKTKVSIVGSRKPTPYTRQLTFDLAQKLANSGVCIVSGAAMGVDAVAHQGAGSKHTIAVMANGLDRRYPAVNSNLIESIEHEGLCLSPFQTGFNATKWSFVARNEIVAALGDILIVTQADRSSGSLHSVRFAKQMGKKVFVLPQRLHESLGTNDLLSSNQAEAIFDIDAFVQKFAVSEPDETQDGLLEFCRLSPTYEEALSCYGDRLIEYELDGKICVVNGHILTV